MIRWIVVGLGLCASVCATTGGGATGGLTLGFVSPATVDDAAPARGTLADLLSGSLQQSVHVQLFATDAALVAAITDGKIDMAWLPPLEFVAVHAHAEITPVAKLVRRGFSFYRSVLFTTAESQAKSVPEMKGKKVAWVDQTSASGYLVPRSIVSMAGFKTAELFGQQSFLGTHAAVCRAVLDGTADVGATFADDRPDTGSLRIDGCAQALGEESAGKLRIVAASLPIPNDVIAVKAGLSPALAARIGRVFQELAAVPEGKVVLKSVFKADGFTAAQVDEFSSVANVTAE